MKISHIRKLAERERVFWRLFKEATANQLIRISDCQNFIYEENKSRIYSYRLVRDESQLTDFVRLTNADSNISGDERLSPKKRQILYEKWYKLSPKSFLSLWRRDPTAYTGEVIAGVSIILPISEINRRRLWNGEIRNVHLEKKNDLIVDNNPPCLLIDVWLLTDKALLKSGGYGHWLIPLHVSLFWDGSAPLTVLAEPVNDVTFEYCHFMGLQENEHGSGFSLQKDTGAIFGSPTWDRFQKSVEAVRSWPVSRPALAGPRKSKNRRSLTHRSR